MLRITKDTSLGQILKENPEAHAAIVGLDPSLKKFSNPLLKRILAGRTTLAMASELANMPLHTFFECLRQQGFKVDEEAIAKSENSQLPEFIATLESQQVSELDVREIFQSGKDPLGPILERVNALPTGGALRIIHTFEPVPLIKMLEKQRFTAFAQPIAADRVDTWFYKPQKTEAVDATVKDKATTDWDVKTEQYRDRCETLDVRNLEMPQPMLSILAALDTLPEASALFVYHKRIPVFLFNELSERNFDYRIQELGPGEVRLLIYRN